MQKINVRELLRLDSEKKVRPLHIVLANRGQNKIGEIDNIFNVNYHPTLTGADEFTFNVYKKVNGKECRLWHQLKQRKLIWVKEYDEWFQIAVQIDDSERVVKKIITATSLCEAELSQRNIQAEINTESDISREDYTSPTIFYDEVAPDNSLLNRVLKDKGSDYTIKHVDYTLNNIQRSFSIDTNIYDFFTGTLATEVGCLFLFNSSDRGIYVYDMETTCLDCGYRSDEEFTVCPKCGKTHLHLPYGKDTSILIDKNNLGSGINLSVDNDSVKNCFNVIGGDDAVNATLRNINPNGSNQIYYFDEDTRSDMPTEMTDKIDSYNIMYDEYTNTKEFSINQDEVTKYNAIVNNIKSLYPKTTYELLQSSYVGFSNLTTIYYDSLDLSLYLESGMMPTWDIAETTAEKQLALLTTANLSPVAVQDVSKISVYTANNTVLAMAKTLINTSLYKVEIIDSSIQSQDWKGKFKISSYSVEDDTAENTDFIGVKINDDYKMYINQSVDRAMKKFNDTDINNIFAITELDKFKSELKKYSVNRLTSFDSAYQTALDVLIKQGTSSESSDLHDEFYLPYFNKKAAIESELQTREQEIKTVTGVQDYLQNLMSAIQDSLNFKKYMGTDLWKLFLSYMREDNYSNENYISDGLSNSELIALCKELLESASKELVKSGEKQYSITATLHNLLLMKDEDGNCVFEAILDDFTLGNFIRCKIDGTVYRMRLIDINIDYSNISQLTVTFSEVTKIGSSIKEQTTNLVKQVTSMATTYSSVKKQADKGEKANYSFEKLQKEGLDSAQYNIFNTDSTFVLDNHGLLGRNYDDVNDSYSDEQVRLNGSDIIFTTDNWKSTELAIGKQKYTLNGNTHEEYSVNAKTVIGGKVISGDIYSANYTTDDKGNLIKGTHFDLTNGSFGVADGKISYDNTLGKLKIKDVAIDWSSSSNPSVDNIEGLDDKLNDITETIDENLSKKYSTTTQMNSAIAKSAEGIKSQVSKTYTTKTEFADLKIGGRNLFLNSLTWKNAFFSNDGVTIDGEVAYMSQAAIPKSTPISVEIGEVYTVSYDVKADVTTSVTPLYDSSMLLDFWDESNSRVTYIYATTCTLTNDWKRFIFTFTVPDNNSIKTLSLGLRNTNAIANVYFKRIKLEKGNKSTDWTPAPEDDVENIYDAKKSVSDDLANYKNENKNKFNEISGNIAGLSGSIETLNTNYSEVKQSADSLTANFYQQNTTIVELDGKITKTDNNISAMIRQSIDGIEIGRNDNGSKTKVELSTTKIEFSDENSIVASINSGKFSGKDMELEESGSFKMGSQIWLRRGNGHLCLKALG